MYARISGRLKARSKDVLAMRCCRACSSGRCRTANKLRLAAKHNLQELFLISVGVAEESNFFEQFHAHEVSFVDQQDRGASLLLRLEEHLVERSEAPWLAGGGAGDFVFVKDRFEKFGGRERWIHKKCGNEAPAAFGFFRKDLQRGVQQRGLAGSDRSSHDGETLALENALEKNFERGAVRIR